MSASSHHPHAFVESQEVGEGTRIGAFAVVHRGSVIGRDCDLRSHVVIQAGARIGDRVTIHAAAQVSDHVRIEDDVSIGPNVAFCSQHSGLTKDLGASDRAVVVRARASIGANATILPGVVIGPGAVVGAGSVVTRSVPPHAVVVGNPARIVQYTDAEREHAPNDTRSTKQGSQSIRVDRVQLLNVPIIRDLRGSLSAREIGKGLPFVAARFFVVFDVPSREIRGEHAHRQCEQFLICLNGSISVVCDDGQNRQEFVLDSPEIGLYLPPMVWGIQYRPTERAQLVVLASHGYDPDDYIRNYDDFLRERRVFDTARALQAKGS